MGRETFTAKYALSKISLQRYMYALRQTVKHSGTSHGKIYATASEHSSTEATHSNAMQFAR